MSTEIGERLKSLRKEHGYTQRQISEYLDISQSAYALYEQGKRNPPLTKLIPLTDIYNTSPEHILYGEQPTDNKPHFKANKHTPIKVIAKMNKILTNLHEMHQIEEQYHNHQQQKKRKVKGA